METAANYNQPMPGNTFHPNFPNGAPMQKSMPIWPPSVNSGMKAPMSPVYPGISDLKKTKPQMPPAKKVMPVVSAAPNTKANSFPGKSPLPAPYKMAGSPAAMDGMPVSDWGMAPAPAMSGRPDVLHCPPQQGGSFSDPQTVQIQDIYKPIIVQHIHPMHTQVRTHYIYEHQHFYPHTMSQTCDSCHRHVQCGRPCFPQPHC
ncbi:MAG: CotD family spore coat protein [Sporolactobacillus sp.]